MHEEVDENVQQEMHLNINYESDQEERPSYGDLQRRLKRSQDWVDHIQITVDRQASLIGRLKSDLQEAKLDVQSCSPRASTGIATIRSRPCCEFKIKT